MNENNNNNLIIVSESGAIMSTSEGFIDQCILLCNSDLC